MIDRIKQFMFSMSFIKAVVSCQAIKDMKLTKTKLYVDSAEARSIAYFKQEGINAYPCAKGSGSVKAGLMFLQDHLIVVHPSCQNFITELENFSYIKSK